MSVPCSNFSSDLLCEEDSTVLSGVSRECSSDLQSQTCSEESIASFIEDERNFVPGCDFAAGFRADFLDVSVRAQSVAWVLKVRFLL